MRYVTTCPRCFAPLMAGEDHPKEVCAETVRDMIRKTTGWLVELTASLAAVTAETDKLADAFEELTEAAKGIPPLDDLADVRRDETTGPHRG